MFINLRNYTENTFLTGIPRIKDYVSAAKKQGLTMLAISDKNRTHGVIDLVQSTKWTDIKPLIGVNILYETDNTYQNFLIYPKNNKGYENFLRIVSAVNLENKDLFKVKLPGSIFSDCIITVDEKTVNNYGKDFLKNFFKEGDLYFEIQPNTSQAHFNRIKEEEGLNRIIITNPTYFINKDDADLKLRVKAIKDNMLYSDIVDKVDENYFKTKNQMYNSLTFEMSKEDYAFILDNVYQELDKIQIDIQFDVVLIPKFTLKPEEEAFYLANKSCSAVEIGHEEWWVRYLCYKNFEYRYQYHLTDDEIIEMVSKAHEPELTCKLGDMELQDVKENAWSTFSEAKKKIIEKMPQDIKDIVYRIEYELYVIHNCGYDGYTLIVSDYVGYAKDNGYAVGPGRGSAAGSIVSFLTKITDIDPIVFNLSFERYLNFSRVSAPDIDVDFSSFGRQLVYEYCVRKYGAEYVAPVCTFGKNMAKSSLKDMGRVMGLTPLETLEVTKAISPKATTLQDEYKNNPDFRSVIDKNETYQELYENAKLIEGKKRQQGVHACAVIIAPEPIVKFSALQYPPNNLTLLDKKMEIQGQLENEVEGTEDTEEANKYEVIDADGQTVEMTNIVESNILTQLEAHDLESLGLLKMDFLVIKNLSILERTLELVKERTGETIDISKINYGDSKVYETIFQKGETVSIFQFESAGMRKYLKELKPEKIEHLIAMNALYRPGPLDFIPSYIKRKNGKEDVEYLNAVLEDLTKETYGIIVYQEQLMKMAELYSGYSMKEADELRKGVGKKKKDIIDKHRELFVNGAEKNGHSREQAEDIYLKVIIPAASYSFNKSHSACYSVIAYQGAYLKTYYPLEYMYSCMVEAIEGKQKEDLAVLIKEFYHMGGKVLPVDINKSDLVASIEGDMSICLGFQALAKISSIESEKILAERRDNGDFESFEDFVMRMKEDLGKKLLLPLFKANAFRDFEDQNLLLIPENINALTSFKKKNLKTSKNKLVLDLNNLNEPVKDVSNIPKYLATVDYTPATDYEIAKNERDIIGEFVSINPCSGLKKHIHSIEGKRREIIFGTKNNSHLDSNDKQVTMFGMLESIRERTARSGRKIMVGKMIGIDYMVDITLFTAETEEYGYILENSIGKFILVEWTFSIGSYWRGVNVKKVQVHDPVALSNGVKSMGNYDDTPTDMTDAFKYCYTELDSKRKIHIAVNSEYNKEKLIKQMEDFKAFLKHQDLWDFKVFIQIGDQEKYTGYDVKDYTKITKYFKSCPKWGTVYVDGKEFRVK